MEERKYETLYSLIKAYASENHLFNTLNSLSLIRGNLRNLDEDDMNYGVEIQYLKDLRHCLCVCQMLIDLHIPLAKKDEDIMLAASICHILMENNQKGENIAKKIIQEWQMDMEVYKIAQLIYLKDDFTDSEKRKKLECIQDNKIALLIILADRGNIIQQLPEISSWSAHRYIDDTRTFYFPMCIYAKEHHPEILAPVSVLMEKMRSLIEVTEILLKRYEAREVSLVKEIIALKEENATIKGMIQKLQK